MNSTPDEKPQRATAAQMAQRRIKDVRRRTRPNTAAPSSTTASFGGPFNSLDPNTVSSTSPAPQPVSNGFSFGQSQSFPGAGPNPSQPSQPSQNGSTPFSFGSGGSASSSFNFSSSFGGSTSTASNPFASMNTGGSSQPSDGGSFSGFKGNMFSVPPAASSAPTQQPLPSGGIFGTGSQQNSITGGIFGNSTTGGPSAQSATIAPTTTGGIFGQNSATSSTLSTGIFGQSASNKPSPFGQSTAFGESMQTSPDAKNNNAQSKPSIFGGGASQSGFGTSTNFSSPGTGSIFGGSTSKPAETPKPPVFGLKSTEQTTSSTSLFGATTQPSSTPTAASAAPAADGTTAASPSSSIFGTSSAKPATPFQNPFQSTDLFGSPASSTTAQASEGKEKQEKTPEDSQTKVPFQFGQSTGGPSLFSQSTSSTAPSAPSSGLFQPPSTGNLFTPKPPTEQAKSDAEQAKSKPAEGNPFGSLFAPKQVTPSKPAAEQTPLPSTPFGGLFAPKPSTPSEGTKADEQKKPATPAPLFSASTSGSEAPKSPSLFAPQSMVFSAPTAEKKIEAPAAVPPVPAQSPFKVNGTTATSSASSPAATAKVSAPSFENLRPSGLPADLDRASKEGVETLYRLRMLNECFRREVNRLDPAADDFDTLVQFYMRVRETIGAPAASQKRKAEDKSAVVDGHSTKKVKPFGVSGGTSASDKASSSSAPASTVTSSTPTNIFGASQETPASNKRKSVGDENENADSPGKRVNGDSTTASIFAQSFSKSKSSESSIESAVTGAQPATPSFRPSTPDSDTPALFSTTPVSSPPKPLFATSTTTKDSSSSTSLFSQSAPASKPTFSASTSSPSTTSNPFVLKPSGDKGSGSAPAPLPGIPKFSAGATNFFSQFTAKAEKDAKKEKAKRKAEDFDSDEEDEAEWERRDAEEQRKKKEALKSQPTKRSRFVPGRGFVFEDEDESSDTSDKAEKPPTLSASTSVFDKKTDSPAKSNNIFGHLSATPSEADENDDADDTEEASAAGEDPEDTFKDTSLSPTSDDESSEGARATEPNAVSGSGAENSVNDSSDDGDLTKALKRSKQDKTATSDQSASDGSAGGRSLFDRVEYNQDGKPRRENDEEQKPLSTFFNSSKYASSFNSPGTPNLFPPTSSKPEAEKGDTPTSKPATPNPFANLFGSPSTSAAPTPSIFAPNASKAGTDNTWKMNSPIKFATDTNAAFTSKPTPAADSSKPFSSLFGAPPTSKPASSGTGSPSPGFSFGGPSQPASFLAPSTISSAAASRASTPGVTSDTGAEESGDGDAAESLPQVNLAQSRAGEENEDVVIEARARGLKLTKEGWDSQGVGFLRVLKDRTTSRGRVILRADPSGKVVLNVSLVKEITYTVKGNSVHFLVPQSEGPPEQWAIRVKKEEAERLGSAMEETKA
ncbi:hypothetical protein BBP40_002867 [Aspergillus hancockii]|nr:hypothetical protein BBP40_002867 [Aspergillus hancockii]